MEETPIMRNTVVLSQENIDALNRILLSLGASTENDPNLALALVLEQIEDGCQNDLSCRQSLIRPCMETAAAKISGH